MFQLFPENQKYVPKSFSGKKRLKNVTLQILNFIPKLTNKIFPHIGWTSGFPEIKETSSAHREEMNFSKIICLIITGVPNVF